MPAAAVPCTSRTVRTSQNGGARAIAPPARLNTTSEETRRRVGEGELLADDRERETDQRDAQRRERGGREDDSDGGRVPRDGGRIAVGGFGSAGHDGVPEDRGRVTGGPAGRRTAEVCDAQRSKRCLGRGALGAGKFARGSVRYNTPIDLLEVYISFSRVSIPFYSGRWFDDSGKLRSYSPTYRTSTRSESSTTSVTPTSGLPHRRSPASRSSNAEASLCPSWYTR